MIEIFGANIAASYETLALVEDIIRANASLRQRIDRLVMELGHSRGAAGSRPR